MTTPHLIQLNRGLHSKIQKMKKVRSSFAFPGYLILSYIEIDHIGPFCSQELNSEKIGILVGHYVTSACGNLLHSAHPEPGDNRPLLKT